MGNAFASRPLYFVVDDEIDIAKLLVVILQMNLFDAVPFADPREALEAAKVGAPDYLISDIVMPEMTGIELAISIRRDMPDCKVLLFSGKLGALELIQKAEKSGHNLHLLEKPVHPTKLIEAMRAL
jgi:DNA-binding NtrC family response regulator